MKRRVCAKRASRGPAQGPVLCPEAFSLTAGVIRDTDGCLIVYGVLLFYFLFLIADAPGSEGGLASSVPASLPCCVEAQATARSVSASHRVVLDCVTSSFV